ncbi:MAG: hypothetical protein U0Z53_19575 [Blastocatellia bacterium]
MQAKQSLTANYQRTIPILATCITIIGLFILMNSAARARSSQGMRQVKLSVEDPRPVAKLIEMLEEEYGWVITYEDPRYVYANDIEDVTLKVCRDLDKYKPGEAPKVLVPRGGILEFTYDVAPDTKLPTDPVVVVQRLLDAQAASSHGSRFRLEKSGIALHVVPAAIKNKEGKLVPQGSVLDTVISLPAGERTILQKLESLCGAISRATSIPVELGTIPDNWFSRRQNRQGATNQKARDILVNTFATMDHGANLSWQLFYGPGTRRYILNIHLVRRR